MIPKASLKEFEKEFRQLTGDSIKKLVMAKIVETPGYVVKELGLEFPPGQEILWGLLIFGQKDLHFFVHATESAIATMFRNATNGTPPRQQYLHVIQENILELEALEPEVGIFPLKKMLPFLKGKPKFLRLKFQGQQDETEKSNPEKIHPSTLIFEPIAGLQELTPLLQEYCKAKAPSED